VQALLQRKHFERAPSGALSLFKPLILSIMEKIVLTVDELKALCKHAWLQSKINTMVALQDEQFVPFEQWFSKNCLSEPALVP
jgi:hypothetical protein